MEICCAFLRISSGEDGGDCDAACGVVGVLRGGLFQSCDGVALVLFHGLKTCLFDFSADLFHAGFEIAAGNEVPDKSGDVRVHDRGFHLVLSEDKKKEGEHRTCNYARKAA